MLKNRMAQKEAELIEKWRKKGTEEQIKELLSE